MEAGLNTGAGQELPIQQAQVLRDANVQPALALKGLVGAQAAGPTSVVARVGHLLHAGNAVTGRLLLGSKGRGLGLLQGKRRDHPGDEGHRRVLEDAGGVAGVIADNHAAGDLRRIPIDTGVLHGKRVGQAHVAVETLDEDRGCAG